MKEGKVEKYNPKACGDKPSRQQEGTRFRNGWQGRRS